MYKDDEKRYPYQEAGVSSKAKGTLATTAKRTFGIDTMSEDYDMNRVKVLKQTSKGQPALAWDYDY